MYKTAESPEFTGKAVVALAVDKNKMAKSGKILLTPDLALEYGFTDSGGYFSLFFPHISSLKKGNKIFKFDDRNDHNQARRQDLILEAKNGKSVV